VVIFVKLLLSCQILDNGLSRTSTGWKTDERKKKGNKQKRGKRGKEKKRGEMENGRKKKGKKGKGKGIPSFF